MSKKLFIPIFFIIILSNNIFPQTDSSHTTTEEVLNNLLEESQDEDISSDLYDVFEDLLQNPINLNKSDGNELQRIPYIDFSIAEQIITHRNKYGRFFSTNELFSIKEIPPDIVKKIIPFVTVSQVVNVKAESIFDNIFSNSKIYFRSRTKNELQATKGFTENKFAGSNLNLYNRFQINLNNNFQFGILTDKDAGEKKFNEFTSAHFFAKDLGYLKNLAIGDYYLEFGQGLTLWNAYGFSKGADAIYPVKKNDGKIVPYTSSSENNFLRGIAGTIDFNPISVSLFYSKNKFDANIDGAGEITSTPLTGLHRTDTEISERKTGEETLIGGRIDFLNKNLFKIGILHYQSVFNHSFQPFTVYDIDGNKFSYTSAAYDVFFSNIIFFGEAVYDETSVASITNLQLSINRNLQFVSSVRSYPRNFVNLHGFSFGERSGAGTNEFGIYNGLKWRLPFGILNLYYDQFKFPYADYNNPLPSEGNEIFIELNSKQFKKVETIVRYKNERKELSFTVGNDKLILLRERENIRFEITYEISRQLRWKTRFEYNIYSVREANLYENGFLFFQDLRFIPGPNLNIYGRMVFFKTDSFNSAIYEYENDLTGILTNVAMYGEGIRLYLLLRYKVLSHFSLSCKYSETYKPKEKTLGSGYSEINGNLDNRINLQLDLNF